MLFIALAYYFVQASSSAANPMAPITAARSLPSIYERSLASEGCTDQTHCRTMIDIIWGCLVTILACTWVSLHPNIPYPRKKESSNFRKWIWNPILSFFSHKLPLFVTALLVPEYILAWAIKQWLRAREIANKNQRESDASD